MIMRILMKSVIIYKMTQYIKDILYNQNKVYNPNRVFNQKNQQIRKTNNKKIYIN